MIEDQKNVATLPAAPAVDAPATGTAPAANRLAYFPYIEGLRGLGAFYVMTAHIYDHLFKLDHAPYPSLKEPLGFFKYGTFSIAIFIVISGFVLSVPLARRLEKPFDVGKFLKRRAQRLMPAYLVALVLSVVPYYLSHALIGSPPHLKVMIAAVVLHAALVHNLFHAYYLMINAPMWTIALECQIYLVFAFLLVPVWRRFGAVPQLAIALVLGLVPHWLLHGQLDFAQLWFLGLFAMGVAAADLTTRKIGSSIVWPIATVVVGVAGISAMLITAKNPDWQIGYVIGAAVALFLTSCAGGYFRPAAAFLSSRIIAGLGAFSYSLYLVHGPFIGLTAAFLIRSHAPGPVWLTAYGLLIPVILLAAYGLYVVAERPFMSATLRSGIEATTRRQVSAPVVEIAVP